MVLTDEEIIECWNEVSFEHAATKNAFGRAVESAVIEKLANKLEDMVFSGEASISEVSFAVNVLKEMK